MLAELREDNQALAARMREAHDVCDEHARRRDREPPRGLDRRDRAADVVPVRGEPAGGGAAGTDRLLR